MAKPGRQPGTPKTGGRKKGTPNRVTRLIAETLQAEHVDPIIGMARMAKNTKLAPELRFRAYAQLAEYLHPKRKAVELSAPGGGPVELADVSSAKDRILRRIAEMAQPPTTEPSSS